MGLLRNLETGKLEGPYDEDSPEFRERVAKRRPTSEGPNRPLYEQVGFHQSAHADDLAEKQEKDRAKRQEEAAKESAKSKSADDRSRAGLSSQVAENLGRQEQHLEAPPADEQEKGGSK